MEDKIWFNNVRRAALMRSQITDMEIVLASCPHCGGQVTMEEARLTDAGLRKAIIECCAEMSSQSWIVGSVDIRLEVIQRLALSWNKRAEGEDNYDHDLNHAHKTAKEARSKEIRKYILKKAGDMFAEMNDEKAKVYRELAQEIEKTFEK